MNEAPTAEPLLLSVADVAKILGCSLSAGAKCIREVNEMDRKKGRFILRGKANRFSFFDYVGMPYNKGEIIS